MAALLPGGEVVMYKKQLKLQKIACLLAVIAAALCFVYSLGVMTDIYDSLYATMMDPNHPENTKVPGSIIYYDMQGFNKTFLMLSIGMLLVSLLLYLTNTQVRRKYYIGNYAATGIYSVYALGLGIWMHVQIDGFRTQFLTTVDFAALKEFAEMWSSLYTESTFFFDVHYAVLAVIVLSVAALIANAIWKTSLMKAENQLLEEGMRKEAAV